MELFGIRTPIIRQGDNLVEILSSAITQHGLALKHRDILVLAETAVATAQGRIRRLSDVTVSSHAKRLSKKYQLEPELAQLVIDESEEILGGVPHVLLTITSGILCANAGIDRSNAPPGYVVLLPEHPAKEAWRIKDHLESLANQELGIIIADSRTQPLRLGTVGLAVAVAGFEPVKDLRGQPDLYGRLLRITRSAVADNLASAAQVLLGEANEQTPAVLIRGAPVHFTRERISPSALTIPRHECLYFAIFEEWHHKHQPEQRTEPE
ncbi:MAG: coenzyme F420-0:L-glutamate ligase [Promethearchaeota archaeon]